MSSHKIGCGQFCCSRGRVSHFVFLGEFYPAESGFFVFFFFTGFFFFFFVLFGQYPWDKNLNGLSVFKIRRCCLPAPASPCRPPPAPHHNPPYLIRSRQFSFDRGGLQYSCLICYSFWGGFDVKYKDWAEQRALDKNYSVDF